jgi:hypothetical protein
MESSLLRSGLSFLCFFIAIFEDAFHEAMIRGKSILDKYFGDTASKIANIGNIDGQLLG